MHDLAVPTPWPTEIRLSSDKRFLTIVFDDGASYRSSAEYLRVFSPSAEVQGHGAGQAKTVPGKRDVEIRAVETIGNYAVKLVFDDGHDTGFYTWKYLEELGLSHAEKWADYLERLCEAGLSRDTGRF